MLRERIAAGQPLAAICGATLAPPYAGLLDDRPHTSNSLEFLTQRVGDVYAGQTQYRDDKVVSAGGVINAPGTSPFGFAEACLRQLQPEREADIARTRAMFAGEFSIR